MWVDEAERVRGVALERRELLKTRWSKRSTALLSGVAQPLGRVRAITSNAIVNQVKRFSVPEFTIGQNHEYEAPNTHDEFRIRDLIVDSTGNLYRPNRYTLRKSHTRDSRLTTRDWDYENREPFTIHDSRLFMISLTSRTHRHTRARIVAEFKRASWRQSQKVLDGVSKRHSRFTIHVS